jgi:hypothetical protein
VTTAPKKRCKDCGFPRTLGYFYKHPSYADGHMNTCKRCHVRNVAENRELKEEQYRAMKRRIAARQKYKEQRAAYARSERGREVHAAACRRYCRHKKLQEVRA